MCVFVFVFVFLFVIYVCVAARISINPSVSHLPHRAQTKGFFPLRHKNPSKLLPLLSTAFLSLLFLISLLYSTTSKYRYAPPSTPLFPVVKGVLRWSAILFYLISPVSRFVLRLSILFFFVCSCVHAYIYLGIHIPCGWSKQVCFKQW